MNKFPYYSLILLCLMAVILSISQIEQTKPKGSFHYYMIDLNSAASGVLQQLPGVGKKTAINIILEREIELFKDWDDFKSRVFISKSKYAVIQKLSKLKNFQ